MRAAVVLVVLVALAAPAMADDKPQAAPASSMPREDALQIALADADQANLQLQLKALQAELDKLKANVDHEIAERDQLLKKHGIEPAEYGRSVGIDLKACGKDGCPIRRAPSPPKK